jgi:DNA-binding CsgD family transcriptional regulator
MAILVLKDTQKLNQAIQQIYSLHDRDTFGVAALAIVDRLVPSDWPLFHVTDVRTFQVEDTFLPGFPALSPELLRVKLASIHENSIAQNMIQALQGACKISDFISEPELHYREAWYQQFLRPLDIADQMMLFLPNAAGSWVQLAQANVTLVGFALNRSARTFTERDRLILNLLRPHLAQAYGTAQKYQQIGQDLNQLQQSLGHLGLIILDTAGLVQWMTAQATTWLEAYFTPSTAIAQLPDELWLWVRHQVKALGVDAARCVPFTIEQSGKKLTVRLVADRERDRYTLLLEEETTLPLECLPALGLSQRETEVMGWLMQGKDNKTIALEMSVHVGTVRKHLENIYAKLGVQSRTAAIACALEKLGWLS